MLEHLEPIPKIEEKSIKDLVKKFCEIKELPIWKQWEVDTANRSKDILSKISNLIKPKVACLLDFVSQLPNGKWNREMYDGHPFFVQARIYIDCSTVPYGPKWLSLEYCDENRFVFSYDNGFTQKIAIPSSFIYANDEKTLKACVASAAISQMQVSIACQMENIKRDQACLETVQNLVCVHGEED